MVCSGFLGSGGADQHVDDVYNVQRVYFKIRRCLLSISRSLAHIPLGSVPTSLKLTTPAILSAIEERFGQV